MLAVAAQAEACFVLLQPYAKSLFLQYDLDFVLAGQPSEAEAQKLVGPLDALLQLG
jgi:hypothetical protein